ncbi:hypothetical protein KOW79_022137 [Hemibagrus wyckioides]|uniref:Uncharacterized protein n=1 Tax=Hemibagrus wyckioides TaxID=337641 RepID=A0A9D3N4U3_9TELE|nr:hypothetical protein KOW79_022137 [Hemibagrus wyckioides]
MQKSRLAVVCLIVVFLAGKSVGSKQDNTCLKQVQDIARNLIKPYVNNLSMNCYNLTEKETQFVSPNQSMCIFKWGNVNYMYSQQTDDQMKLIQISKFLNTTIVNYKCTTRGQKLSTTCKGSTTCLVRFLKCWCGFLESSLD